MIKNAIGRRAGNHDIAQRKPVEDGLKEAYRRLEDSIEFLPDPTFVIDTAGRIPLENAITGIKIFAGHLIGKIYNLIEISLCHGVSVTKSRFCGEDRERACHYLPGHRSRDL